MGTLRGGLMHEYFRLFQHSSQGLIVGNVELVEDRIPGTLLSFPLKSDKESTKMPEEGWPRTGFVHEALFYVEVRPVNQWIQNGISGTIANKFFFMEGGEATESINKATSSLVERNVCNLHCE
jgi:hypothetical protein